jgi:Mn-dependent DtxR family transcriptional regulator
MVSNGSLRLSILDMADFPPGAIAQFFTEFAAVLIRRMRGVLYLVIEEAHLFAPKEKSGTGHENLAIHWAKTLATAGRSKGIRLIVMTQRTQALHNAVLGSCDTLIAHRMTAPADQKPIIQWLQANCDNETVKKVSSSLSSLKTGVGWICSGEAQVFRLCEFPNISTYDNTATPTDDVDRALVKVPPVDIQQLSKMLEISAEEVQSNDVNFLKAKIAKLQKEIEQLKNAKPETVTAPNVVRQAVEQSIAHSKRALLDWFTATFPLHLTDLRKAVEKSLQHFCRNYDGRVLAAHEQTLDVFAKMRAHSEQAILESVKNKQQIHQTLFKTQETGRVNGPPIKAAAGPMRLLRALAGSSEGHLDKVSLAIRAQLAHSSGTTGTYLSELKRAGYIEPWGDGEFALTAAGRQQVGNMVVMHSNESVRDFWMNEVGGGKQRILQALHKHGTLRKSDLAQNADLTLSGTFDTYLSSLSKLGLISKVNKSHYELHPDLR